LTSSQTIRKVYEPNDFYLLPILLADRSRLTVLLDADSQSNY
jgi:hypothetical protein